jgi:hypothetical protein
VFPHPTPIRRVLCGKCETHYVRVDRLVAGRYGEDCARRLGLLGSTTDVGQDGPTLLDLLPDPEPEDHCDGDDR